MSKKETIKKRLFTSRISNKLSLQGYPLINFPFRLLLFLGLFLIGSTFFFLLHNMALEEDRLSEEMKSRADVLIWALEGGARSLKPDLYLPPPPPSSFLENVASQPNIMFVAILDEEGIAVAHSNPQFTGAQIWNKARLKDIKDDSESKGVLITDNIGQHFDVIKAFMPVAPHMRNHLHGSQKSPLHQWLPTPSGESRKEKKYYILVSIAPGSFLALLHQQTWHTLAISSLLVLSTITGVALLIFIRNFNTSKKLLQDTQAFALQVFDRLPLGVFTVDQKGNITLCNKESICIIEGLNNASHIYSLPWIDWKYFIHAVDSGALVFENEYEIVTEQKKRKTLGVSAFALTSGDQKSLHHNEYLFFVRDLGEVKKLQKQVRLNERLTALGNLAAGVAHEIRNPLSTIKGYATYLANKLQGSQDHSMAELMLEEMERLNRVVSDLLNMAQQDRVELHQGSVLPVIEKVMLLAHAEASSKGVTLESSIICDATILLNEDKLLQALLNLVINAIQATESGKKVRIVTSLEQDSLLITIQDEGHGMDAETQSRLFSPYFTTKPSGTGLGLTISHQIIEQHSGQIRVQSEKAKGSSFTVILPETKDSSHA